MFTQDRCRRGSLTHCLGVREIPYKAPHRRRPNLVLRWVAALPMTVAQNYHTSEMRCAACTSRSISPKSRGVKHLNCSHPQKARMPISWSSVGMTISWSAMQLRKTSLPICVRRGGSQMWVMATHWAKVDLRRAVISVHMRLTSTSRLQFSQARGPML